MCVSVMGWVEWWVDGVKIQDGSWTDDRWDMDPGWIEDGFSGGILDGSWSRDGK